jgi:hypothetical protein
MAERGEHSKESLVEEEKRLKLVHSGPIRKNNFLATPEDCERRDAFLRCELGKRYLRKLRKCYSQCYC